MHTLNPSPLAGIIPHYSHLVPYSKLTDPLLNHLEAPDDTDQVFQSDQPVNEVDLEKTAAWGRELAAGMLR